MRKFITSLLIITSTNCIAQDWAEYIAKKFYSTIDSSKKLDCCDKSNGAITIDYTHNNYELPFDSRDFLDPYYSQVMDTSTMNQIANDLIQSFYRIPKKYRDKFKKSCFNIETNTQVSRGYQTDLVFVEGKVHFVFSFQGEKPYKRTFFKKLFGRL